jgi:hypothetical protein
LADLLVTAGQALSVIGLGYGWYLTLLFCENDIEAPTARGEAVLLHHLAMT